MKKCWAALLGTLIVILPARLYVLFALADPVTGFYSDGGKAAVAVSVLLVVGLAVILVFCARSPETDAAYMPLRHAGTALCAALVGVFTACQSVAGMLFQSDGAMAKVFSGFGLLAAAAFLIAAYDFASGSATLRRLPGVALFVPIWGCLGLISLFGAYDATVNRLENVYHTFTVAFLLLFLFSQAKFLTGVESEKSGKRIFVFGMPAAVMTIVTAVPNTVLYFAARKPLGSFPIGLHLLNIVMAIYILCYLAVVGGQKKRSVTVHPAPAPVQTAAVEGEDDTHLPQEAAVEPVPDEIFECAELLQKSYHSEEKFVENPKNAALMPENIKS